MVLARLSTARMRVEISKSKFFAEQIEYLRYWILCYPDFNNPFHLYTDASDHQLGAVIM
jgi:hypothetical protein